MSKKKKTEKSDDTWLQEMEVENEKYEQKRREERNAKRRESYRQSKLKDNRARNAYFSTEAGVLQCPELLSRRRKIQQSSKLVGASHDASFVALQPVLCSATDETIVEENEDCPVEEQVKESRSDPPWAEKREKRAAGWEEVRPFIFKSFLKCELPKYNLSKVCASCKNNSALVRCGDGCGYLCIECDASKHKFVCTHLRCTWVLGYKVTLKACEVIQLDEDGTYRLINEYCAIPVDMKDI